MNRPHDCINLVSTEEIPHPSSKTYASLIRGQSFEEML